MFTADESALELGESLCWVPPDADGVLIGSENGVLVAVSFMAR